MQLNQKLPNLQVMSQNKAKIQNTITHFNNFTTDYRFNSASESSFQIPKMIYNEDTLQWIKNPTYDKIQKGKIIRSTESNDIFKFNGDVVDKSEKFSANSSYQYSKLFASRTEQQISYYPTLTHCYIQPETQLYDIGNQSGYAWHAGCYFDNKGGYCDSSDDMGNHYKQIACQDFFPVENGDIIAMVSRTKTDSTGDCPIQEIAGSVAYLRFIYYIYYYSDSDASTYLYNSGQLIFNPSGRIVVDLSEYNLTKGYIRICALSYKATYDYGVDGNSSWHSYIPDDGYVYIFSGERRITNIVADSSKEVSLPLQYWIINNIDENSDVINTAKTVTMQSYETILSNRTFSLSADTLPLYVPPSIVDLVTSDNWKYDVYQDAITADGETTETGTIYTYYHKQRMKYGLLNQILDYLPNWSLGYISVNLCAKYRTFDDVDNANLYTFLMNDVQSAYQCFFIFDTQLQQINVVSKEDVCNIQSNTYLTWQNAIKELNVSDSDTKFVTALRVHAGDDQYGLGLINPTGNAMMYDFSSYEDQMNFVADTNTNRTLNEALNSWKTDLFNKYFDIYRKCALTLIQTNMDLIKAKTKLSEALTAYRAKADVINVYLQDDYKDQTIPDNYYISDSPRSTASMKTGIYKPESKWSNYHSRSLYSNLYGLAQTYEKCKANIKSLQSTYDSNYVKMQKNAVNLSLNYKTVKDLGSATRPQGSLTATELKALDHFIVEGDWSNANATFSNTYSARDIYDTLVSVYDEAQTDFSSYISKPNYEFTATLANIFAIPEMATNIQDMYIGNAINLRTANSTRVRPVLLSVHIDYDNPNETTMTFSTDYKRKPLQMRFIDLFGTINQTSVETPTFTFDK